MFRFYVENSSKFSFFSWKLVQISVSISEFVWLGQNVSKLRLTRSTSWNKLTLRPSATSRGVEQTLWQQLSAALHDTSRWRIPSFFLVCRQSISQQENKTEPNDMHFLSHRCCGNEWEPLGWFCSRQNRRWRCNTCGPSLLCTNHAPSQ